VLARIEKARCCTQSRRQFDTANIEYDWKIGPGWVRFTYVDFFCYEKDCSILTLVFSFDCRYNHEPPEALEKLHTIGDKEEGWLQIIMSMINIVPVDDPLGPAVITVVLDDCPLPNKVLFSSKLLFYF